MLRSYMRRAWPIALIAALFFVSACDSGGSNGGGSGSGLSGPVTVRLESSGSSVTAKASGTLSVTFYYEQEDGSACPDRTTRSIGSTPADETFDPNSVVTSCSSPDAFDGVDVSFAPGSGSSASGLTLRVLDSNESEIAADTDPSDGLGVSGGTVPDIGGSGTNRIAFTTDLGTENTTNIYTIKPNGSDRTQVTDASANDRDPAWKPDGSRIVFSSNRVDEGSEDLYTINPDGTGLLRLTSSDADDEQPAWSPDGSRIAFARGETIYTMNPDGSDVTQVTQSENNDEAPDWKPNGNRFVFESSNRDGDGEANDDNIYTIKPDGSDPTPVIENDDFSVNPEWSPDGSKIAFAKNQICLQVPGGSGTCAVTNNSFDNHPSWKSDGSRLVFSSDRDGDDSGVDTNLFLVSPDGSNLKQLTDLPGDKFAFTPSWGP